jgi:nicotinamide-nucleotide amidase
MLKLFLRHLTILNSRIMMYDISQIELIKDTLIRNKRTLAVAESVTAGHLQVAFSQAKNASAFFQGGITAYNYGQKCRHLHIEPIHALQCNCVSEAIARQMALEVNKMFLSDYGIAITGYATRMPEQGITDLFAFAAITLRNQVLLERKLFPIIDEEGLNTQIDYTNQLALLLRSVL